MLRFGQIIAFLMQYRAAYRCAVHQIAAVCMGETSSFYRGITRERRVALMAAPTACSLHQRGRTKKAGHAWLIIMGLYISSRLPTSLGCMIVSLGQRVTSLTLCEIKVKCFTPQ